MVTSEERLAGPGPQLAAPLPVGRLPPSLLALEPSSGSGQHPPRAGGCYVEEVESEEEVELQRQCHVDLQPQ